MEDEEKELSFVSSSLQSVINDATATLNATQLSLQQQFQPSPAKQNQSVEVEASDVSVSMTEDDEDRRLKQEILDKMDAKKKQEEEKPSANEEEKVAETENLLLDLLTGRDSANQSFVTADTPLSPNSEGVECLVPKLKEEVPSKNVTEDSEVKKGGDGLSKSTPEAVIKSEPEVDPLNAPTPALMRDARLSQSTPKSATKSVAQASPRVTSESKPRAPTPVGEAKFSTTSPKVATKSVPGAAPSELHAPSPVMSDKLSQSPVTKSVAEAAGLEKSTASVKEPATRSPWLQAFSAPVESSPATTKSVSEAADVAAPTPAEDVPETKSSSWRQTLSMGSTWLSGKASASKSTDVDEPKEKAEKPSSPTASATLAPLGNVTKKGETVETTVPSPSPQKPNASRVTDVEGPIATPEPVATLASGSVTKKDDKVEAARPSPSPPKPEATKVDSPKSSASFASSPKPVATPATSKVTERTKKNEKVDQARPSPSPPKPDASRTTKVESSKTGTSPAASPRPVAAAPASGNVTKRTGKEEKVVKARPGPSPPKPDVCRTTKVDSPKSVPVPPSSSKARTTPDSASSKDSSPSPVRSSVAPSPPASSTKVTARTTDSATSKDSSLSPAQRSVAPTPARIPMSSSKSRTTPDSASSKGSSRSPAQRSVASKSAVSRLATPAKRSTVGPKPVSKPKANASSRPSSTVRESIPKPSKRINQPAQRSVPSRLFQSTAASQARAKSSPTSPTTKVTVRKPVVKPEDGVAKAKQRVRQNLVAKKTAPGTGTEEKKPVVRSTRRVTTQPSTAARTRETTLSAEEGRALARERVRQRQEQAMKKASSIHGKENSANSSTVGSTAKRTVRSSTLMQSTAASQRRTIPKSPGFQTTALHGRKAVPNSDRRSSLDPNPITRALGSPTHSDAKVGVAMKSRRTVPVGPRLSTEAKYGKKAPPSLRSRPAAPPPPKRREFRATQPVPFHFHGSSAAPSAPRTKPEAELSLAEQVDLFQRKALRLETCSPPRTTRKEFKPTIAKSPAFSAIPKRPAPKSTAEREEEMMEYNRTHPFRARRPPSLANSRGGEVGVPKVPKRRLTTPHAFHFRVDERSSHWKPPEGSPDPGSDDLKECEKQFHARPLPRKSYQPPQSRKETSTTSRVLTTPEPFSFMSDKRASKSAPRVPTPDEVEMSKQFHARPLPQSTFSGPKRVGHSHVKSTNKATPQPHVGPPKLNTSARTEPRRAARDASRKNAEVLAQQKKQNSLNKVETKHQQDMAKATQTPPSANIQPFRLKSEERHEAYQRKLAEERARQDEEERQKRLFHAKPLKISAPPSPIHSDKSPTTPEPFPLKSVERHDQWVQEQKEKSREDELERQRHMNVKARPVPKTTYEPEYQVSPSKKTTSGDTARDEEGAGEVDTNGAAGSVMDFLLGT